MAAPAPETLPAASKRRSGAAASSADRSREELKHKVVFLAPDALRPYENNPTLHPAEHIDQIIRSIREFGFTVPVLVDEDDMILAGHGRQLAALEMKLETIPVIRRAGLSETQKRAYVIADNKIARNAELDWKLISGELLALKDDGFDLTLTGFAPHEFEPLLEADWSPPAEHDNEIGDPDLHHIAVTPAQKLWIDRAAAKVGREMKSEQLALGEVLEIVCRKYCGK